MNDRYSHATAITALAGTLPLLAAAPAPLMDWPSHLARVWITTQVLDGNPFWTARYAFEGFLIPNAILDIGVYALSRLGLPLGLAGTVFLLLVYAAFIAGAARLAARIGTRSALTIPLAVTIFYSTLVFYGLVNYVAGLAALLWALDAWCRLATRPWHRAALALAATAAIALCHVIAAALFLGVAACLDLPRLLRKPRLADLVPCATILLTLAAILALSPVAPGGEGTLGYNAGGTLSGLLYRKAVIFARAMSSGQPGPDTVMALTAAVLALAAYPAWRRTPWPWALAAAGLLALAVAAPDVIGQGAFLDARLVPSALLILAVALPLQRTRPTIALLVAALVVLRVGWIAVEWRRVGRLHATLETALAQIPPGTMLLAGSGTPGDQISWADEWSSPSGNIAALAVPHGVLVPSVFASPVQQPLALRPPWAEWRRTMDVGTPEGIADMMSRIPPACERESRIDLLVLHYRPSAVWLPRPYALFGPAGARIALTHLCPRNPEP